MTRDPVKAGSLNKYGFQQADDVYSIDGVCPTILAHGQGTIGHQINLLVESVPRLAIPCDRQSGVVYAYDGDCVGITFMAGGKAHNVVSHGVSRALTTMCDHDIGVVTYE